MAGGASARDEATVPAARSGGRHRPHHSRSLAEDLRGRTDAGLATLLRARPDLARPAPTDLVTLTARALTPASLRRALDALDTPHLAAVETASVVPEPITAARLSSLLDCPEPQAASLLSDLHDLALLWRTDGGYALPRPIADLVGPVAGLASAHSRDATIRLPDAESPADLLGVLTRDAPRGARDILERLTWGPATGTLDPAGPLGPACRDLVARGLLRESEHDPAEVTLPRPVALALRGGRLHREMMMDPPGAEVVLRDGSSVDAGAGAQAGDVLALVEEVANAWGAEPPRVLRSGGLAVRDLAATCSLTGLDTHALGALLETLRAAGLLAQEPSLDPVWAPTAGYDAWLDQADPVKWADLALAWAGMNRAPHRIGTRRDGGVVNALSDAVTWGGLPGLRRRVLDVLAALPAGGAVSAADAVARLCWEAPRSDPALVGEAARATMVEAEFLGVTSAGALTSAGRALLAPEATPESVAATVVMPDPVDRVLLQADLTAVAPGRLDARSAAFLRQAADIESRGGAATFRFSTQSVRRILDAGWTPEDILGTLGALSLTGVPQPLEYLVHDAARGHGAARIGAATSYVRSDDVAALDELLVRPEARNARLRRLAPTVLVSPLAPTQVLSLLREAGTHALVETAEGTVISGAAAPRRVPAPRRSPRPVSAPVDADAVVAGMRSADSRRDTSGPDDQDILPTDPAVTLALLRQAAAEQDGVWIGVVGADGEVRRRHVRPTRVVAGLVHGVDLASGRLEAWSAHRITGVSRPDGPASPDADPR